uniref:Uncharacterized protein n=1 Tax=Anguilla anguilla TaxID=7936 RepID=A0A0E9Q316_ANGAN
MSKIWNSGEISSLRAVAPGVRISSRFFCKISRFTSDLRSK